MEHRTMIEGPDGAGHYDWHCLGCATEATGYELPSSATIAAESHGPLAATSPRPEDPPLDWADWMSQPAGDGPDPGGVHNAIAERSQALSDGMGHPREVV